MSLGPGSRGDASAVGARGIRPRPTTKPLFLHPLVTHRGVKPLSLRSGANGFASAVAIKPQFVRAGSSATLISALLNLLPDAPHKSPNRKDHW